MKVTTSDRGLQRVDYPAYLPPRAACALVAQSSAIGDCADSLDRPGTSYLWVGRDHHLDREEVRDLVRHLQSWLDTGRLAAGPSEN